MIKTGLKILNAAYATDETHVYYGGIKHFDTLNWCTDWRQINEADPDTFEVLSEQVGRDKNYIYRHGEMVRDADRNTYTLLDSDGLFSKDKNHVYCHTNIINNANPKSIKLINGYTNPAFLHDNEHGYFFYGGEIKEITSSDGPSFGCYNRFSFYSHDKNNVYFRENVVAECDPKTFQLLEHPGTNYNGSHLANNLINYAKDKNNVYFSGQLIPDADAVNFKILENTFACDGKTVYYGGQKIESIEKWKSFLGQLLGDKKYPNANTFRVLDQRHGADDKNVYFETKQILGADGNTFVLLGRYHARDKNFAYFNDHFRGFVKIMESDGPSFKLVGQGYSLDKNFIYHKFFPPHFSPLDKIEGGDAGSFRLVDDSNIIDAEDKNQKYFRGVVVDTNGGFSTTAVEGGEKNIVYPNYICDPFCSIQRKLPSKTLIKMNEIRKIHPYLFNPFNPLKKQDFDEDGCLTQIDYKDIKEPGSLGNYEWFLYQYKIADISGLNELLRNSDFARLAQMDMVITEAKIVSSEEFLKFVSMNYAGCGPYGQPSEKNGASTYAKKLISTILSCNMQNATYIQYRYAEQPDYFPYITFGFYGILDIKNNEYFELLMGGTD
ncbi:MAG: DKNYY domain-containing protein [Candidatus Magasanikbacteria bacterium]|jgi:hypothetical protein